MSYSNYSQGFNKQNLLFKALESLCREKNSNSACEGNQAFSPCQNSGNSCFQPGNSLQASIDICHFSLSPWTGSSCMGNEYTGCQDNSSTCSDSSSVTTSSCSDSCSETCQSDTVPQEGVAADETASVWGDPHITTASGSSYMFGDQGNYSLLKDSGLSVNGKFQNVGQSDASYMTEAGVKVGKDKMLLSAGGGLTINGQCVNLQDNSPISFQDGSQLTKKDSDYILKTKEYTTTFHDKGTSLDADVKANDQGVLTDGVAPTGLLGETFVNGSSQQTQTDSLKSHDQYRVRNLT